jgi:hypothetical protein
MEERWAPRQNWKGLAAVVENAGICQPHCWFDETNGTGSWQYYAFYFRKAMGADPSAVTLSEAELVSLPKERQYPIIAGHIIYSKWSEVRAFYSDWQCLTPQQSWPNTVILLAPKSMTLEGLQGCP